MELLNIQNLSKSFTTSKKVVDQASLELHQGEIIAVVGHSGCGKTTLLRLIAGFEQADTGEIKLNGKSILNLPAEKRNIGFVFQDWALFPHHNLSENLLFGANNDKHLAQDMLDKVGLGSLAKRYPHELSGGQQQRAALARALVNKPKLLLLDEPFSNLDENLKHQLRLELRQIITSAGSTAILVTHDMQDAFAIAQKIVVMKEGRIVQFDTPNSIYKQPHDAYVALLSGKGNVIAPKSALAEQLMGTGHTQSILIRPEHISLTDHSEYKAQLIDEVYCGSYTACKFNCGGVVLLAHLSPEVQLAEEVFLNFKTDKICFLNE